MKPLKLFIGEESKPVIESYKEQPDSLFAEIFSDALREINFILPWIYEDPSKNGAGKHRDANSFSVEKTSNNIFVFEGDRGSGKTSCMMSLANMLEEWRCSNSRKQADDNTNLLKNGGFEILEVIDPSFFDKNVNILEIIIGKLYNRFIHSLEARCPACGSDIRTDLKREVYKDFQKTKECLSHLSGIKIDEDDSIEQLQSLADSVKLREVIQILIMDYLRYLNKDILVIQIDDIDLHTDEAYTMLEQIRKYFCQHNIIVLMALKMNQLEDVLKLKFTSQYHWSMEREMISSDSISEMAKKYLTKLIPQSHLFRLPCISSFADVELQLFVECGPGENGIEHAGRVWKQNEEFKDLTVKYAVTSMIFTKTRFLFYHQNNAVSPIVPYNLRILRNLVKLLFGLSTPGHDDYQTKQHNRNIFKSYFYGTWAETNLDSKGLESLRLINNTENPSLLNKLVIQQIDIRFEDHLKEHLGDHPKDPSDEIKQIFEAGNSSYNISIGDVFSIISLLKKTIIEKADDKWLFAIETLYSMRMCEYYDLETEDSCIKDREALNKQIDSSIKTRTITENIPPYELLMGGYIANSRLNPFIAQDKSRQSRSYRKINLSRLRDKSILDKNPDEFSDYEKNYFRMVEMFSLLISRKDYETKQANEADFTFRQQSIPVFRESFSPNQQNIYIDAACFLPNITHIEDAYGRIDENFYDKAKSWPDSLYNKLMQKAEVEDRSIMSWGAVRNSEVLLDLILYLQGSSSTGSDNISNYISFFDRLSKYKILTYDKNGEKRHSINFGFVSVFHDFLNDFCSQSVPAPEIDEKIQKNKQLIDRYKSFIDDSERKRDTILKNNRGKIMPPDSATEYHDLENKIIQRKKWIETKTDEISRLRQSSDSLKEQGLFDYIFTSAMTSKEPAQE